MLSKINLVNRPSRCANHVNAWGLIVGSYVMRMGSRWVASGATILDPGLTDKPKPAKVKSANKGAQVDRIKRLQEAQLSLINLKAQGETLTGQAVLKASEQYALDDSEAAAFALTLCEAGFLPATQEEAETYLAALDKA